MGGGVHVYRHCREPVSLICGGNVAVIKEFHRRQYLQTKHQEKLRNQSAGQKLEKVEELKKNLTSKQTFSTRAKSQNEAAVKAGSIVTED